MIDLEYALSHNAWLRKWETSLLGRKCEPREITLGDLHKRRCRKCINSGLRVVRLIKGNAFRWLMSYLKLVYKSVGPILRCSRKGRNRHSAPSSYSHSDRDSHYIYHHRENIEILRVGLSWEKEVWMWVLGWTRKSPLPFPEIEWRRGPTTSRARTYRYYCRRGLRVDTRS